GRGRNVVVGPGCRYEGQGARPRSRAVAMEWIAALSHTDLAPQDDPVAQRGGGGPEDDDVTHGLVRPDGQTAVGWIDRGARAVGHIGQPRAVGRCRMNRESTGVRPGHVVGEDITADDAPGTRILAMG